MSIFIKYLSGKKVSVLIGAALVTVLTAITGQAQVEIEDTLLSQRVITETEMIEGNKPPSIAQAGILNSAQDHFFDVNVNAEPLNRLEVRCVTFHELDEVKVINPDTNEEIDHEINYGFEEFVVTFDEPVPVGQQVRIVMEGSTVRGLTTGIIVPYRVFGVSDVLGTIPLGTALVRGPSSNN
ncbi:MAG: hypothetical protein AAGE84_10015 [Cyanobacteria bacterium P01_G01_bin.39]